jgi:hypothetical protein
MSGKTNNLIFQKMEGQTMKNYSYYFKIFSVMMFSFLLASFVPAHAIQWIYHDINNEPLSEDATPQEIYEMAVMRTNDSGTQYALTIQHNFSGTWGTGYLENIGNPSPHVGKHWIDENADVLCQVDGIVQDVYNVNSRYITIGYTAEGAPNSISNTGKADALIFNGIDNYLKTPPVQISKPQSMSFEFWAKRDRTDTNEVIIKHNSLEIGFDENDQAYFHTNVGNLLTTTKTSTGWHFWKFVYERYTRIYHDTSGLGYNLYIYRDDVLLSSSTIEPHCEENQEEYTVIIPKQGCYLRHSNKSLVLGGNDESNNDEWWLCRREWGYDWHSQAYEYKVDALWKTHPIRICADYHHDGICDQCYVRGDWVFDINRCQTEWGDEGLIYVIDMHNEQFHYYNSYSAEKMMSYRNVEENQIKTVYSCTSTPEYQQDAGLTFGANDLDSKDYFKGKLKDIVLKVNQNMIGKWNLNDGNNASIAADSSEYNRHATLYNFDTSSCWFYYQYLTKYHPYQSISTRQTVQEFKMVCPGKIVYDWSRQYAVTVNTLPGGFDDLVSIKVIDDESQVDSYGVGKHWYNANTNLVVRAKDSDCLKLSGYRDNNIDPNNTIIGDEKVVILESPLEISWVFSPYVFEETVVLGMPVMLSTVPPDLRNNLEIREKPEYILQDITENDMVYWNDSEKNVYPLRGGELFDLNYQLKDPTCIGQSVTVRVTTQWPGTSHIIHIANAPPVHLDPSMVDEIAFMALKHVENDAQIIQNKFTATQPGRSVIHFKRNYIKDTLPTEISLSFNGKGFAETDPIIFPENFTIEFYAKRNSRNNVTIAIGHGDPVSSKGLSIGFDDNNHFIFNIVGDSMATSQVYTDTNWHHWACVYETSVASQTDSYTCELNNLHDQPNCHWGLDNCYTISASGGYVIGDNNNNIEEFMWNPNVLITRGCGTSVNYNRKIYCDGELVASKYSEISDSSDNVLNFNGSDEYAEIQYNENLNSENFTVSLWAKVEGGQGGYRSAITSRNGNNLTGYIIYANDSNHWHFLTGDGSWQSIFGESVVLNKWTHLAMTYDGTHFKGYVNGILQDSIPMSFIPNSNCPTRIGAGRTEGSPQFYWNGKIDEVAIYNIALTQEDIRESMNQYLEGNETGLQAYYNFNHSSGTILEDITNNGHNGTVINTDDSNWVESNTILTTSNTTYIGQGNIRIGANGAGWIDNGGKFIGELDEIRIWGVAKTQEEIAQSSEMRLTGDESDLMAYFRMDRIGSSYLDDNRIQPERPIIAELNNMDPSNSWMIRTNNEYAIQPERIIDDGYSYVRVVETRLESENRINDTSFVGYEIYGSGFHDQRVPHNGYVFYDKVPYNASIYNRETLQGPIYPVNIKHPAIDSHNTILIVWYKLQDGVSWPYQPVEYIPQWPVSSDRIVISSMMGTEGKNANGEDQTYADADSHQQNYYDPKRYDDIQIYNQPNPDLPGYNPNEEHAIVTRSYRNVSMAPQPFAAYALRNDLNTSVQNTLSFDGEDDYVDLGRENLKPTEALTVEFWLLDDWLSNNETIIGNTEGNGYAIVFEGHQLKLYICIESGYQILNFDSSQLSSGWHHIAATFDSQYIRFYVDGDEEASINLRGTHPIIYSTSTKTLIGAETDGNGNPSDGWYFDGRICQLRIWNTARTQAQIARYMTRPLFSRNETSLLAYYTFNQKTGTTLLDISGHNRHGTLNNMDPITDWISSGDLIQNNPELLPSFRSEPFVLVQLFDKIQNKHIMIPYSVVSEDHSCNYSFHYYMKAGDPVVPPFPLNEIMGATPPAEIFGFNKSQTKNCYWKDHKGQAWAISGSGDSMEIENATLLSSDNNETEYLIHLNAQDLLINNDIYSIKVTDKRGIIGYAKFRVGVTDANKNNSAIFIDGGAITNNMDRFTVLLRPGSNDLDTTNFKLFHYDEDIQLSSHFWYPIQPSFWFGDETPGDGTGNIGQSLPWLPDGIIVDDDGFPENMVDNYRAVEVTYNVVWPDDVPVLKAGESLTFPGGEFRADHSNYPGLPGVLAWATGQVVYDALNPNMISDDLNSNYLVRMVPALLEREVLLTIDNFPDDLKPASGRVDVIMNRWYFKELHAGLKKRVYYDPSTQMLGFRGFINDKTLGDDTLTAAPPSIYVLQPNILTDCEISTIKGIEGADNNFKTAIDNLYTLSRNPNSLTNCDYGVGLKLYQETVQPMIEKYPKKMEYINDMFNAWLGANIVNDNNRVIPQISFGPGLAVVPNGGLLDPDNQLFSDFAEGYITLAENNHPDMGALPVSLHIIKVVKEKYRGSIKTVYSDNVFDEKITLRHSADFGADPNELVFQWWYREEDGIPQKTPDIVPDKWLIFPDPLGNNGMGMLEISLSGAGAVLLADNLFYTRYRHKNSDANDPNAWSNWAGAANSYPPDMYQAQLADGWVKRVLNSVNPFEARVNNFYNSDNPATYVSMIRQAGPRYEGPVAFNPDKDVVENVGLIQLYQTVLDRAKSLSINLEQPICTPGVVSAILLAASRISSFYSLLGNEAYNDALDPTIGFGTDSVEYGSLAPTIFTFMNQLPELIDEEYALLCGRGENGARPGYNRLLWNFTKGSGEVAYALSYNIKDVTLDGFIDEADARTLYPQGHGDAWGHYLTAVKSYYDLLGHSYFNWISRSEKFSVEGVVIDVDYFDERKFVEAAASKAKVGSEIVNITYRKYYVDDPDGQWQGYTDSDPERAWAVTGWSRRAFMGALFDWTVSNAIIPSESPLAGIKKVDRSTVPDILEISSQARNIQQQYQNANTGINPLGLAPTAVPFDVNPARMSPDFVTFATHFEQIYERADEAMKNARAVFNYANDLKNRIRQVSVEEEEFALQVIDKDREYRNKLIEIFGSPYEGTIGSGKTYPAGYVGPDYYYYAYIDVNEVSEKTVPQPTNEINAFFKPMNAFYIKNDEGVFYKVYKNFYGSDIIKSKYLSTDFSDIVPINFPLSTGTYSFQAPQSWGLRKSPGDIQIALIELIKAEAELQLSLSRYKIIINDAEAAMMLLQARSDLHKSELAIGSEWKASVKEFNDTMIGLRQGAAATEMLGEELRDCINAAAEALPTIVGMSSDVNSVQRAALKRNAKLIDIAKRRVSFGFKIGIDVLASDKELAQIAKDRKIKKANYKYDMQQQLEEIRHQLAQEAQCRMEIFQKREHMRQVSEKYRATLAKGLRLLEERNVFNARVAQKTQGKRYMDMAFRLNLNKALAKYRNAFDIAARYAYLAAKVYDYETNLSDRDPGSAKQYLTEIIKKRHLGQYKNDQYVIGVGGLGDVLASMKVNYNVLKNQMGFNSPQTETGRFSLRKELLRIKDGEENRENWKNALQNSVVDNLWSVPEFRKYCRTFAAEDDSEQPGLIIGFETSIIFGKNFFFWPLSGGDHAYDPTNYATKIRSVGVWFEGYDNTLLSETPRVYLIPVGMDLMLVPDSTYQDTREWSIVDQKLPIPLPVRGSDLNNPDWIPSLDSLDGSMIKIRKFSSFRAYHDNGYFDPDQMSYESRLVGRSVWNTRWMLIIAGGTFHFDPDYGLETFIDNVSDIKIFFQTYAISGN